MVPAIEEWCAAVLNQALHMAYSEGREIPGHKVVASRGQRKVTDPEGAIAALRDFGFLDSEIFHHRSKNA